MKIRRTAYSKPVPKKEVMFTVGLPARTQCPYKRLKILSKSHWPATLKMDRPKRKSSPPTFRDTSDLEK